MSDRGSQIPRDFDFQQKLADALKETDAYTNQVKEEIAEQLPVMRRVFDAILSWFGAMFSKVWTGFASAFLPWIESFVKTWTTKEIWFPKDRMEWLYNWLEANKFVDRDDIAAIRSMVDAQALGGGIFAGATSAAIILQFIGAYTDVLKGTIVQNLNKRFSPTIPDPNALVRTSFIAPELHDKVVDAMKRFGYSKQDIELLFVANYALYTPQEVAELWWRGELDDKQAANRLAEMGFTETRIKEITKLWERIPTLQDVVRYLGKEAFEPAMIAKFGLMDAYPGEATEWAAKQGLAERWAHAEWVSHWRDLGIDFMLQAKFREDAGLIKLGVDWPFVYDYMNLIEIPPRLREIVEKTAHALWTRVDIRRMMDMGIIDRVRAKQEFVASGYDEEHAEGITQFYEAYNSKSERDLTRADILDGYEDGDLSQNEAYTLLTEIGYEGNAAAYLIVRVDNQKAKKAREEGLKVVEQQFTNNLLTEPQARNRIMALGYADSRATELLTMWATKIQANVKMPSKTDLDKMLKAGIIDDNVYLGQLEMLGYQKKYRDWYFELAKRGME